MAYSGGGVSLNFPGALFDERLRLLGHRRAHPEGFLWLPAMFRFSGRQRMALAG